MFDSIVVMPGAARINLRVLENAAVEFGCSVRVVNTLTDLTKSQSDFKSLAVIFHREALGIGCSWAQAIQLLNRAMPGVRLIPCHGYGEPIDWTELSNAGAFHSLGLPLKADEVRQSLGFIAQAEKRVTDTPAPAESQTSPARRLPALRSAAPGRFEPVTTRALTRAAG
jgi:hypothetical protein